MFIAAIVFIFRITLAFPGFSGPENGAILSNWEGSATGQICSAGFFMTNPRDRARLDRSSGSFLECSTNAVNRDTPAPPAKKLPTTDRRGAVARLPQVSLLPFE